MRWPKTPIDKLIEPTVEKIGKQPTYFHPSEAVDAVLKHPHLSQHLADIKKRYGGWAFNTIIERYVDEHVRHALGKRDEHGKRIYECYPAGESERRWLRLRRMTLTQIKLVRTQTRTLERHIHLKGENYLELEKLLEKTGRANAVVDEVYDEWVRRTQSAVGSASRN